MGTLFAASFGDSMKVITILVIVIGDVKACRRKGNSGVCRAFHAYTVCSSLACNPSVTLYSPIFPSANIESFPMHSRTLKFLSLR